MRILHVEDQHDDSVLVQQALSEGGLDFRLARVETAEGMRAALESEVWDIVLSDYKLPGFSGPAAFDLLCGFTDEIPFILVSGAIGEEAAVEMMRAGVTDYVMKDKLQRLAPAIERAVSEAVMRRQHDETQRALQEVRERCRATFDSAAVGIANVSVDGRIIDVNGRLAAMHGGAVADLTGSEWAHWIDAGSRFRLAAVLRGVRTGGAGGFEGDAVRRDGSTFRVSATMSLVRDADGAERYIVLIVEDISARREAEQRLREQRSLLAATIESAGDGIVAINFERHVTAFNRKMTSIWDTPPAFAALSVDAILAHMAALVRDGDAFLRDVVPLLSDPVSEEAGSVELKDGRIISWLTAPQLLDGEPVGRVWSFRDVTEQVLAVNIIAESERRFRSIIENIPDVIWTADEAGRARWVSANVADLIGFTPEELCDGSIWMHRIHRDDVARVETAYRALFDRGERFDVVHRAQGKDRQWRWIRSRASIVYVQDGVRLVDGVTTDVTQSVEAEAKIARMARDRELLLDSTAEGIVGTDEKGICTFANRAAGEILGRDPSDLIGRHARDVFRHDDDHAADDVVGRVLQTGEPRRVLDGVFRRTDGEAVSLSYVAAPVIEENSLRGTVVVFSDVTEAKSTEKKLEQTRRIAALGQVAATIAHEFNNVLMGIQPFAEIIKRAAAGEPPILSAADQIIRSVARGKRVAEEILRYARPVKPNLQRFDLRGALATLEPELRGIVGANCTLNVDLPEGEVAVSGDWQQIAQVVTNLTMNARDAVGGEAGTITLRLRESPSAVQIEFSDSGCGMPPTVQEKIFEPMFTTKRSGTGLGLALAKQVIESHAGEISVESTVGSGTTFRIMLPS